MQDRVLNHDKVTVHFNTTVDDAYPDGKGALAGLHTKDSKSGQDFLHSHSLAPQSCVSMLFIHVHPSYMCDLACHIYSLCLLAAYFFCHANVLEALLVCGVTLILML